ncbi:putative 5-3 exonuclease [Rhizopogon vinicolor AM-OR11-026]|uniref:Putative 5-3 exonuclease n=1 Tax=Rhizopogon vinicolor AM-OR11-026 TaxID=1314800 RepID=A0A1B7MQ64_9AGAM|nr:putative 5-3 exonuclease [Rhizopogon vinicolor AM-OR11-026]
MGIPKFFRYISERYPLTSQLIEENKIPEFDNLYLDFNGIIHNCSHPNDEDAHFRMSEEQIYTAIFAYVDLLFGKIKPKKLFFMAVDGVAPRAKMNQQRSRRFRTAKEAREVREKAESKGEKLPAEKAFDSNCITPGTPFMARLSEQLRYFVNKKISEDSNWRGVQVVLSGHEVPGEGEHKIMEYIRLSRAQPDYNPNIRHCLYGLDADLIMLGLLSHDPHFCLLREEVKFGPASRKKSNNRYFMDFVHRSD